MLCAASWAPIHVKSCVLFRLVALIAGEVRGGELVKCLVQAFNHVVAALYIVALQRPLRQLRQAPDP